MPNATLQLSVIVASFNAARYLEHGLATYVDDRLVGTLEVIVVDDGSTDDTAEVARSFMRRMPDLFRLVAKENGGHGSAVNAGLAAARGRYVRVIDADDWVSTDELVRLVRLLSELDCDLVVDVKTEVWQASGDKHVFSYPDGAPVGRRVAMEDVCARDDLIPFLMIHTLTVRTEYVRSIGLRLLEHAFYVDYEFVVKVTLDAQDAYFADTHVYHYLVGNASQSVADANYVRHWADHARVTWEIVRLVTMRADLSAARVAYLAQRARLIVNTHYNIALIFDADRRRGLTRARAFRAELRRRAPSIARATDGRYRIARAMHAAGVRSQAQLNSLLRRRWRSKY